MSLNKRVAGTTGWLGPLRVEAVKSECPRLGSTARLGRAALPSAQVS